MLLVGALSAGPGALAGPGDDTRPFRVAFSSAFFGDANSADAAAAVVAWQETILRSADVPFNPHPLICDEIQELVAALEQGEVDAVAVRFPEYFAIPTGLLEADRVYINQRGGGLGDEYVLAVHRDSGIETLAQLRGRRLTGWESPRASLAKQWLELLLAEQGLPPTARFFGSWGEEPKLAKVVLPVFFRQADACLVTRSGLASMSELNPQVGQQLRVLATSPEMVASFLTFRAGYASPYRPQVERAIRDLHTSAAGKQVLTVFGCDRITPQAGSCLQSARDLMAAYARLPERPPADGGGVMRAGAAGSPAP
jgi:ABC-type phosphate/phosphonate transport system substrate-binding protein